MTDQPFFARTIKSFVKREGRMTAGQKRAMDSLWPKYGIEPAPTPLQLDNLFGRTAPKILEIGFGAGESLFEMASNNPQLDYLGIEVHRPGVGRLLANVHEAQLTNVRVICDDAVLILNQQIANASLDKVQIFFPDPWHKKRHHKRRIIQPEFVELLAQKIKTDGLLHVATDWQNYAEHILHVLTNSPHFINTAKDNQYSPRPDVRPLTRFEQRGQRLGHGVWDVIFQRR